MRPTGDLKKGNHVVGGCKATAPPGGSRTPGRGVPGIRAGWARADRPGVASRPRRGWTTLTTALEQRRQVHRARIRLLRIPRQPQPQNPQPRPRTPSPRLQSHPRTRRLNQHRPPITLATARPSPAAAVKCRGHLHFRIRKRVELRCFPGRLGVGGHVGLVGISITPRGALPVVVGGHQERLEL